MIDYVYKAQNLETGEIVTAGVKAESTSAAAKLLAQQHLFAIDITPQSQTDFMARLGIKGGISTKDKVLFTRQLSTLINAGLPLARAMRSVQDQIKRPAFNEIIGGVVASVEGGSTLADAFANYPKVFNEIYVALVAAGETSGTLDKALLRLASQQEKDAAIASKIRGALIYPAIVLVLIVGVITLMVATVVPQVAKLYQDLHKTLPIATQILLGISNFLTKQWWLALIVVVVIVFVLRKVLSTPATQYWLDNAKLKVPVFGLLMQKVYMARFARTMSTLLASGIPMLQAMETTQRTLTNLPIQADMNKSISEVRGGKALSQALEDRPHFIPLVPQMIKIGEESGTIDQMMERVASYYEDEVDEAIENLSATLEPVMMIVLGGIVALVLLAVLYPVYSLVGSGSLSSGK